MRLNGVPRPPNWPPRYEYSYAELGIIAERGKWIEIRTPPSAGGGEWPRIYLTEEAARTLSKRLPDALAFALDEGDELTDA